MKAELDELEEEFLDAFDEFRQNQIYYDFKNYKNYYQDAQNQNNSYLKIETKESAVSFKDKNFTVVDL